MTLDALLITIATVFQIMGYVSYNRGVRSRSITPNTSSWIIWGTISLISCTSYIAVSNQNISVSIMPIVVTFIDIATFVSILRRGTFQRITGFDMGALFLSVTALVVWAFIDSASTANILIQLALIIGTIPTIHGVILNPRNERPAPWVFWAGGFAVAIIVVSLQSVHWVAFASPSLQLVMYSSIGTLSMRHAPSAPSST